MIAQGGPDARLLALLVRCAREGGSDLHLSSEADAYLRVDGTLRRVATAPLGRTDVHAAAMSLLDARRLAAFAAEGSVDAAIDVEGGGRFRVNVFRERCGTAVAARLLDDRIRTPAELHLPRELRELARLESGLVLVTGPTGSGKSTTLATLIAEIGRTRACHVLTLEDPIEHLHRSETALVRQRELHTDFPTFAAGVRSAVREDPDVILVGEMRDAETMRAALSAAETGHLVFSTLHSGDAVGAIDRVVGSFERGEQDALRNELAAALRAVVGQRLLPRRGGGRVPVVELLRVTPAVAHLVRDARPQQIHAAMEAGGREGMIPRDTALAALVASGRVAVDDARALVRDARSFELRLRDHAAAAERAGASALRSEPCR